MRRVRAHTDELRHLHVPAFTRRGHERGGARPRVRDAHQRPLFDAARAPDSPDGVQKGIEGFIGSFQKRAHHRGLRGLPLRSVRVRGGGVDKVVDPAAAAAAVPDQTQYILEVVIRHRVGVSRHPDDGAPTEVLAEQVLADRRGHQHQT